MKILIISDAWEPQVNGVVRTYQNIIKNLPEFSVEVVHPYNWGFKRYPLPGYKEIELAINPWRVRQQIWISKYQNDCVHIATEGPLGLFAKMELDSIGYPYTTSFHTLFPEFIETRYKIPSRLTYSYFRWFHKKSKAILVPTKGIQGHLEKKGFKNLVLWTRGVDQDLFNPSHKFNKIKKPYILCVSRVSREKGLDDFCKLDHPRKVLVGDGPYLDKLKSKYKDVEFVGKVEGVKLAEWYANADAFVFPSKTDTFGIVLLESISSGTPVIAYSQPGPLEVVADGVNGFIVSDLQDGVNNIHKINRNEVYNSSKKWSWKTATNQFKDYTWMSKHS
jgi:glycosyltransferase involved in cell wall biosynthesis